MSSMSISVSQRSAWIAGDCWLKRGLCAREIGTIWSESRPGLFVFNLECAIPAGVARPGRRALLALDDPKQLADFDLGERTVCLLANNHISDWGSEGLMATVKAVRDMGMYPLGAGANLDEAREPLIFDAGQCRVGVLAYADTSPWVGSVAATHRTPGVAPLDPALVKRDIEALRARVEAVWVFAHWGREHLRYPEPEQRRLSTEFASAGATLVVGIHPHVLRGREEFSGTPIYYSLGNFVFPCPPVTDGSTLRWHRENRQGMVLKGRLDHGAWNWGYIPYTVSPAGLPALPTEPEGGLLRQKILRLSSELDGSYSCRYRHLRRREQALSALRRFSTMTWLERVRSLARVVRRTTSKPHLRPDQG